MLLIKNQIFLGVNIDHVATVRQARGEHYPDPVHAAMLAEQGGADGITVHLREDKRHIQPRDVRILKEVIQTRLNLEMAATNSMLDFACQILPKTVCLVPEKREELTTEGGLDVLGQFEQIKRVCHTLMERDITVSLFIDADEKHIVASKEVGATLIELHTGTYAAAKTDQAQAEALRVLQTGAKMAHHIGLQVNAGHGLNYQNVIPIAAIPEMVELNIGHAIVSQALMMGMVSAVKEMKTLMQTGCHLRSY